MKDKKSRPRSTAKDVFSYLLLIILLTISVVSFGAILWQEINFYLPDNLDYYSGIFDILRTSIASLVVAWPIFIFMSWSIQKDLTGNADKGQIWVRRWLLYLTLFVASIAIIIDSITLLNEFLGGELTTRFILKALVVLLVSGAVFGFYLWELRRDTKKKDKRLLQVALASTLAVIIVIISAFVLVGTPAQQRDIRLDEQRVYDLQNIQSEVINYWLSKNYMPIDLESLDDSIYSFDDPLDPDTDEPYDYTVTGDLSFRLCADFQSSSNDERNENRRYIGSAKVSDWSHEAEWTCFDRTIDPDLYDDGKELQPVIR